MVNRVKCVICALVLFSICIVNKLKFLNVTNGYVKYFTNCYLNDILGTIVFLLYLCFVLSFQKRFLSFRLIYIEIITLLCGFLWEFVTPLYRKDTISDPWDLIAYMIGSLLFWLIYKKTLLEDKSII